MVEPMSGHGIPPRPSPPAAALDIEVKPGSVTAYIGNGEPAYLSATEARRWAAGLAAAADAADALGEACAVPDMPSDAA